MKKFFRAYGTSLFILSIPFQVIITLLTFLVLASHGHAPQHVNAKTKAITTLTDR